MTHETKETLPLIPNIAPATEAAAAAVSATLQNMKITDVDTMKATAEQSLKLVAANAMKAKNNMKRSPWIVSLIVAISCFGITSLGAFEIVTYVITFNPILAVIKVYQVFFAVLCLILEASRYYDALNIKSLIHRYVAVLELNLGRGLLNILTASLSLVGDWRIGEAVPGALLCCCGVFSIIWGIQAAVRVKNLFAKLKAEIQGANVEGGETGIVMIMQKFKALDINGDGKLSKEELEIGCKSLNIELDVGELNMVFNLLDPKGKGFIGIDDFENWWYSEKSITAYIV